jgi:hypothetical protein
MSSHDCTRRRPRVSLSSMLGSLVALEEPAIEAALLPFNELHPSHLTILVEGFNFLRFVRSTIPRPS